MILCRPSFFTRHALSAIGVAIGSVALAETADDPADDHLRLWQRDHLFGDWAGARTSLTNHGVDFELVYTSEYLWNLHGGLKTGGEYRADASLTISVDTARAKWWAGGEFFMHIQGQHGDGLTEKYVGDFQTLSNIDADDFFQISEVWYRHTFASDRFWIKLGKQEANADFAYTDFGGEFISSSPGFSPTIPLVTYPDPDWGVAMGAQPVEWFSINAGLYQGRPDGGRSIGDTIDTLYGPMFMVEPSFHYTIADRPGHLRLGYWWNGDRFEKLGVAEDDGGIDTAAQLALLADLRGRGLIAVFFEGLIGTAVGFFGGEFIDRVNGSESKDETHGFYATWDQTIFANQETGRGLGVFAQFGYSDEDVFEAERYFGGGIQWTGPFARRPEDIFGLGVFHVNFSEKAGFDEPSETVFELFYKAQVTPWFNLKPDFQYIVHPGGQRHEAAWVAGFRTEISF